MKERSIPGDDAIAGGMSKDETTRQSLGGRVVARPQRRKQRCGLGGRRTPSTAQRNKPIGRCPRMPRLGPLPKHRDRVFVVTLFISDVYEHCAIACPRGRRALRSRGATVPRPKWRSVGHRPSIRYACPQLRTEAAVNRPVICLRKTTSQKPLGERQKKDHPVDQYFVATFRALGCARCVPEPGTHVRVRRS